jgi:hypothetical protein
VGFAANTPSSEEIRQAASGSSTPQVELAVELDPDAQHYGGSLRVSF